MCTFRLSHIDPTAVLFLASDWAHTQTLVFPSLYDLYKSFMALGVKHIPVQSPITTADRDLQC